MAISTSFLSAHNHSIKTHTQSHEIECDETTTPITPREHEVLNLIAYEYSSKEIAQKLYVSYETINSHRKNMMDKLGVKNTAGLVRVAFEKGLMRVGQVACVLLAFLAFSPLANAQLLTGLEYNYEVHATSGFFNSSGSESGDEHIVWLVGACHDVNNATTEVIPSYSSAGSTTCSGQILCRNKKEDFESGRTHDWTDTKILNAPNESDTEFDLHYRAWESDSGGGCTWESGDDERCTVRDRYHAIGSSDPNEWSSTRTMTGAAVNGNDGSNVKFKTAWRYSLGTKNTPIDFGVLNGQQWHRNANRPKPSTADNNIGYTDDWGNGDIDVTYEFTISGEAKNVRITTDWNHTDYDTFISLLDNGDNQITAHGNISATNKKSTINRVLCPGTYKIRVEGEGNDRTGNFEIDVKTTAYSYSAGSITATQTSACITNPLAPITGSFVSALNLNDAEYQWERFDFLNNEYEDIAGKKSQNLSGFGDMDEEDVRIRRKVTLCGVVRYTSPHTITYTPSENNPGDIYIGQNSDRIDNVRIGYDNYALFNQVSPSGFPSPITHQWIKKTAAATVWDTIPGETSLVLLGENIEPISSLTTNFRRVSTNSCGVKKLTPEKIIEGREADGFIQGFVRAPGGTGIENVEVCADPINGITGTEKECDDTDPDGMYKITPLYYAKSGITNYKVTPLLAGHKIRNEQNSPDSTKIIELDNVGNHEISTGADFVDISVYEVSGQVTQLFQEANMPDASFGKSKVVIYVQEKGSMIKTPKDTTDVDGNYALIIEYAGDWIITPELVEDGDPNTAHKHTFSPSSDTIEVDQNIFGVDFVDDTEMTISGFVGAGCNKYLGKVDLRFFQDETKDGKFDRTFKTSGNGTFSFTLPAREYKVMVGDNSITEMPQTNGENIYNIAKANDQFKAFDFKASLSHRDTSFNLQYKAPAKVQITGEPAKPICASGTYNFPLIEQGKFYKDFKITVFEGDPSIGCKLDTGFVDITDDIGSRGSTRLPISKGNVDFLMQGGEPNVVAATNYLKTLSLTAKDLKNDEGSPYSLTVLVTGEKKKKSTFVTVSPEIPLYVLHDPPTDHGYSFLEKNNSTEISIRNFTKDGTNDGGWITAKVGFDISQSFGIGAEMGFNAAAWVTGTLDHNITEVNNTTDESIIRITNTERISTSSSELAIGEDADVFYGAAFNYTYALTDKVDFKLATCEVDTSTSFFLDPDSIATTYVLTGRAIKNTINELKTIKMLQHPDSMIYYQNQIDVWEQTLQQNKEFREAKAMTTPAGGHDGNFTVAGDVVLDRQWVSDIDTFSGFEYLVEVDKGYAIEAGLEIAGNGISDSYFARVRTETGESKDTTVNKTVTTGYTLSDDDPDDKFTIDIHTDERYGTPLFVLRSALSSCPYEAPQFLGLDQFEFNHAASSNPSRTDILPSNGVAFQMTLSNTGTQSRTYKVTKDDAYNPDAAEIQIGSNAAGLPGEYTLNAGQTIPITIIVNKNPAVNVFSYRDLKIDMDPICNVIPDSSRKTLFISVSFRGDCSHLDVTSPSNGTVINAADNNNLDIRLQNYDKTKLTKTVLQYRLKGETAFINSAIVDLLSSQLENGASGTQVSWSIPDIYTKTIGGNQIPLPLEGEVEFRFLVLCEIGGVSNVNYSNITTIVVDRKPPEVFGFPTPIDDIYDISANDVLSVAYNEDICQNSSSTASAIIVDLATSDTILTTLSCNGNTIKIIESGTSLNNRPPSAYRVILSGVTDDNDNAANTYRWVFLVGEYDPEELGCIADLEIVNNNENQDAINVSTYRALNIVSSGAIPNFGSTSYNAQNDIVLKRGFSVSSNGVFIANIEDCVEN